MPLPEPDPQDFEPQPEPVAEIMLSLLMSLGVVIYMMVNDAAPWRWLVELQAGWFDGEYYPKMTGAVLFLGALMIVGPIISFLGSRLRGR